jgi:hypothetical protein
MQYAQQLETAMESGNSPQYRQQPRARGGGRAGLPASGGVERGARNQDDVIAAQLREEERLRAERERGGARMERDRERVDRIMQRAHEKERLRQDRENPARGGKDKYSDARARGGHGGGRGVPLSKGSLREGGRAQAGPGGGGGGGSADGDFSSMLTEPDEDLSELLQQQSLGEARGALQT